ncbi:MAG: ATP-binding cassette domain-containing protein [Bacteroidales bacterium]|nr:ATP-binding cassette domain-containing protein [Bacteroidales bacterium]MBO7365880.1 ATP-binding cassette domain-containing protein [Bacteroidales bacterium]MBR5955226.1 ATP-binding cassette domain-containing protein [Bacteroidales bacterium]MBR6361754.1 ATP-binding cassette domain-containing protein [Bacteroidales bacterium]MEE3407046.1 ATP-binding cassette domain-containing protein [Candidatus Cryptobacteroides sp.]
MIKINDLKFSYNSVPVLTGITTDLEEGKIYGLLGENGVGKTTLLTLLCGLKKVEAGYIETDGIDPYKRLPETLQNQYYLPDEVAPVNMKAISYAESAGKFWPRFDFDKFLKLMELFENDPLKNMAKMSAGQLKKTYIAFALACNTKYLFMDEPTNGLDIPSKTSFRSAISKYTSEYTTVVISTHQVRDLENIIDPIIILDRRDVLLNASEYEITSKLFFDYGNTLNPDSLFTEQIPGGFIQVYENKTGEESKINVEALFNTVHNNKEYIKKLFRK